MLNQANESETHYSQHIKGSDKQNEHVIMAKSVLIFTKISDTAAVSLGIQSTLMFTVQSTLLLLGILRSKGYFIALAKYILLRY